MKIEYSLLTGNIYIVSGTKKQKITDEAVLAIQVLLHNGFKFNKLYSKLDNKYFELILKENDNE